MADFETIEIEQPKINAVQDNIGFKPKPVYDFFKRVFDILSSFIVSTVLLIPIGIVSLLIILKDKGSPFYFHKRVGKNFMEIKVCKFRSMKKNADDLENMLTPEQLKEYKKEYKIMDDPPSYRVRKNG